LNPFAARQTASSQVAAAERFCGQNR